MSWLLLRIFEGQRCGLMLKASCGLRTICILATPLVQKQQFHSKATLVYRPIYVQDHFLCQEGRHFHRSTSVTRGLNVSAASVDETASELWPACLLITNVCFPANSGLKMSKKGFTSKVQANCALKSIP